MKKTLILIALLAVNFDATVKAQDQNEQAIITNAATKFLILSSQEKWLEAKPFVQQAYELGLTIYTVSDPQFGPIAYHYGAVQVALREASSLLPLTQAKNNYQQNLGDNSLQLIPVLGDLASAYMLAGNFDQAEKHLDRAIELASDEYGKNSTMIANLSSRAGKEFSEAGNYTVALELQDQAHEIYLGVLGPKSPTTGEEAYQLSESFRLNQNIYGQVTFLKKTVDSFDQPEKAKNEFERTVHTKLVEAYQSLEKPKRATKHVLALAASIAYQDKLEPTLLVKANATYRSRGERTKLEGFVLLKFDVDSNGMVQNINLLELEGDRKLVKLAIGALKDYRYIPVVRNNKTVKTKGLETKIVFKWGA
ncbi:MAG: tetratricopeptide repeat protein [Arenicella sp.]|nr:tetratricopeptide repeat protein [Arenicella sp.]